MGHYLEPIRSRVIDSTALRWSRESGRFGTDSLLRSIDITKGRA